MLPITYIWQPPWADPADSQLHPSIQPTVSTALGLLFQYSLIPPKHTLIFVAGFCFCLDLDFPLDYRLDFAWIMASSTSTPSTSSTTAPVDVHARRCTRRMSNLTHDQHIICVSCRDIDCSVAVRCDKCREWSTETMSEYVRYKRTLVSESKKPKVTTPSASAASVAPSEFPAISPVASPSPSSVADDEKLRRYVQSFFSMFSQQSQMSLDINPTLSAPSAEVPNYTRRGSAGETTAESLISRSVESPSSMVPVPPQEYVMSPTHVSVSNISSLGLAGVSGVPSPSLGVSLPSMGRLDQLRDRGDVGLTSHIVSADVHSVPCSFASFDHSSLLFPCSDSGFSSLSAPPPLSSFSASLSSFFSVASTFSSSALSSSTVPLYSLPSVVPSVLASPLPSASSLSLSSSSFSVAPPPGFTSASPSFSSASLPGASAPSCLSSSASAPPFFSWGSLPFSASSSLSSSVPFSSSSSSAISPPQNFASFQASMLGLSAGYQALGRWYVSSGVGIFIRTSPLIFRISILTTVLTTPLALLVFSALSSAPPPVVAPDPFVSSSSLPSSCPRAPLLPSAFAWPLLSLSSLSFPVVSAPSAPVPLHTLSPPSALLLYSCSILFFGFRWGFR